MPNTSSVRRLSVIPPDDTHVDHLVAMFNGLFQDSENTVLVRGDEEPVYLPPDETSSHARIVFAHGFFASALHEIAHWCVAGVERRRQVDFGYWYAPDGRSAEQQEIFESLEIKPQAIEWILARAAGFRFRVSCDNLLSGPFNVELFKRNIHQEVMRRLRVGLPERTQRLVDALAAFYQPGFVLKPEVFSLDDL